MDQVLDALRGTDFRNAVNIPFPAGLNFTALRPYMELGEKMGIIQHTLAPAPITRVEVEVRGEGMEAVIRPVASALLKGLLQHLHDGPINYINAPILAAEHQIAISQTSGMDLVDYSNLISCRVHWEDGQRLLSGVLFGGAQPRIVQVDEYQLDARPQGTVLVLQNDDVPGVVGQVGTILAAYTVNIGEWRMGRERPGGQALSFINLDGEPPDQVLAALAKIPAVTMVKLLNL